MKEILAYYKDKEQVIVLEENRLNLGSKYINYNDIFYVNEDYIVNYNGIYSPTMVVTSTIVSSILSLILFKNISLLLVLIITITSYIYAYYYYPKTLIKNNNNKYIKVVDIFYSNKHESLIIKASDSLKLKDMKIVKKNIIQKRILSKYLSRIKKSYKYLISQVELNDNLDYKELYLKYQIVATNKYALTNHLSQSSVERLVKDYRSIATKYINIGFKLARLSLLLFIIIIIYSVLTGNLNYKPLF